MNEPKFVWVIEPLMKIGNESIIVPYCRGGFDCGVFTCSPGAGNQHSCVGGGFVCEPGSNGYTCSQVGVVDPPCITLF